jgi:hypothetical protein
MIRKLNVASSGTDYFGVGGVQTRCVVPAMYLSLSLSLSLQPPGGDLGTQQSADQCCVWF